MYLCRQTHILAYQSLYIPIYIHTHIFIHTYIHTCLHRQGNYLVLDKNQIFLIALSLKNIQGKEFHLPKSGITERSINVNVI